MNTLNSSTQVSTTPARRSLLGNSPLLARLARAGAISALAVLAACSDDNGKFTSGNKPDAGISSDSGAVAGADSTTGADAGSTAQDAGSTTPDAGTAVDTSATADTATTVDTSVAGTDASVVTADVGTDADASVAAVDTSTVDTSVAAADVAAAIDAAVAADTSSNGADTSAPIDTSVPSTPDITSGPVKVTKSAPADETMSAYKPGMELPIQQVIVSNKPYTAVVGFGHKDTIKSLGNDFASTVNGADVYTIKMADLPQDESIAGTQNFRVVTMNNPAGSKIGTYVTTLTGKKAQDGVTPINDQGAILPVLCDDGEYSPEDATLLTKAMTMTGKMEFNHNLQEMRDTYVANLQKNIIAVFGAAGKAYAPICEVQMVTPGTPGIVDGQVCPVGCLVSYVEVQPIASWTEQIQSGN